MALIVFGAILLVMTLVAGKFMAKEPENPNCGADVADVKNNKIQGDDIKNTLLRICIYLVLGVLLLILLPVIFGAFM